MASLLLASLVSAGPSVLRTLNAADARAMSGASAASKLVAPTGARLGLALASPVRRPTVRTEAPLGAPLASLLATPTASPSTSLAAVAREAPVPPDAGYDATAPPASPPGH